MKSTLVIILAVLVCGCSANTLKSPVDVAEQRSQFSRNSKSLACPLPKKLPNKMETIRYYTDDANSIVDESKFLEQQKREANVRANENALAQAVSSFVTASSDKANVYGECILAHLLRFAKDEAFIGTVEFRGSGTVRLLATGPIFAYMVLHENFTIPPENDRVIRSWITKLADQILTYQVKFPYPNNPSYWAGAALSSAAVALNERRYLEAAIKIADGAMAEINSDGLLPRELARGERALEYNLFATQALSVIGVVAQANGVDLFHGNKGLLRLMRVMAEALKNPQTFVNLTGNHNAIAPERIYRQNFAWLVIYRNLTGDRSVDEIICSAKPLYTFRAGGDWYRLFGNASLCKNPY